MNTKILTGFIVAICLGLPFTAQADNAGGGKRLVLNLLGTGPMYESTVPDIDGDFIDDDALCFDVDVGVINGKNRQIIGTATDCLSNIEAAGGALMGLKLIGTTFFNLPNGTLITRGKTTVQPVLQPTITPAGNMITHATAAAGAGNAIIGGTGRFAGVTGTVRLGGLVDLSNFTGQAGTPIFFDCLFIVDLD
ncbi:MAG: hypothetical protein V7752_17100 [Halopseudomonas sp.]